MICPGIRLHCPGCSGKQSLGVLAAVVAAVWVAEQVFAVVAEYFWWIIGTLVVCFALATAASMWLERLSDARCAGFAERRGIASRADVDQLTPAGIAYLRRREQQAQVGRGTAQPVINFNFYAAASSEPVSPDPRRVIRQAVIVPAQEGIES